MSYLVMECHPGYAVVLDEEGHFQKVPNMNYEVGECVTSVVSFRDEKIDRKTKWIGALTSLAACLCLLFWGSWYMMFTPYGMVQIKINPEVEISVSRLGYVINAKGLNADGRCLLDSYNYRRRKVDIVVDDLADRAVALGYLSEGGTIRVGVSSGNDRWKIKQEERLYTELSKHMKDQITIEVGMADKETDGKSENDGEGEGSSNASNERPADNVKDAEQDEASHYHGGKNERDGEDKEEGEDIEDEEDGEDGEDIEDEEDIEDKEDIEDIEDDGGDGDNDEDDNEEDDGGRDKGKGDSGKKKSSNSKDDEDEVDDEEEVDNDNENEDEEDD